MLINKQKAYELLKKDEQLQHLIQLANDIGIHDIIKKTDNSIERLSLYYKDHSELDESELYAL